MLSDASTVSSSMSWKSSRTRALGRAGVSCNSLSRWRTASPIGARPSRRSRRRVAPTPNSRSIASATATQNAPGPPRHRSRQSHATGRPTSAAHSASSVVLPEPAGAMSNVTGTSSSSTSTRRWRRTRWRGSGGTWERASRFCRRIESIFSSASRADPTAPPARTSGPSRRSAALGVALVLVLIPIFDDRRRHAPSSLRTAHQIPSSACHFPRVGATHPPAGGVLSHRRVVRSGRGARSRRAAVDARCRRGVGDPAARGSAHEIGRVAHRPRTARRPGRWGRRPARVVIVALLHDVIEKADITPCALRAHGRRLMDHRRRRGVDQAGRRVGADVPRTMRC